MSSDGRWPVNVLCVDDHAWFRNVVRDLIAATPGFIQVGEAASAEDAISQLVSVRPDLVLMDVCLQGMNGFDAAALMVERRRHLVVVLMSVGSVEPPGEYCPGGGEIAFVPKQELSPRILLDVWHGRRTRYPGSPSG